MQLNRPNQSLLYRPAVALQRTLAAVRSAKQIRAQKYAQMEVEQTSQGTGPPHPSGKEDIPHSGKKYKPHCAWPPGVHASAIAPTPVPFRPRILQPCTALARLHEQPERNKGNSPLWPFGPSRSLAPGALGHRFLPNAPKSSYPRRNCQRGWRRSRTPSQYTLTGHL